MFRPLLSGKRKSSENDGAFPNKRPNTGIGRNPLGVSASPNISYGAGQGQEGGAAMGGSASYWMIQWRKPQQKKHKTWDGDAVMSVHGKRVTLQDMDGKTFAHGSLGDRQGIAAGDEMFVGGKEIEVDCTIPAKEYLSGTCFGSGNFAAAPQEDPKKTLSSAPFKPHGLSYSKPPLPVVQRNLSEGTSITKIALKPPPKEVVQLSDGETRYFTVNWRKPQNKVHKTWDGDAYLVVMRDKCVMQDRSGKIMGTGVWKPDWTEGSLVYLGGKEVQVDASITQSEFETSTLTAPPTVIVTNEATAVSANAFYGPSRIGNKSGAARPDPKPMVAQPRHDPLVEGAFVLPRPSASHIKKYNKSGKPVVDVVVDPILAEKLRPHQREGLIFMYEAVMGMRRHEGMGCILADEMGLGKTLQTIALIWTLLKQSPYGGQTIGKALIVCPVSLVNNWRAEFIKWLGRDRVGIMIGDKDKSSIKQFQNSRNHHVLVIGYEKLRTVIADLTYCVPAIGLIVCDEGHRLKSANNKTSKMFEALSTNRRVILSGTPIQNDLGEFWAMADFCNPGLLDDYNAFKRLYEQPIVKSRTPGCKDKDREIGEARSEQLGQVSKSFVLRRTADILSSYLPPKHEYVVFIRPTPLQLSLFGSFLNSERVNRTLRGSMAQSLALINTLGKVCSSPVLLKTTQKEGQAPTTELQDALNLLPSSLEPSDVTASGKMIALASLLETVKKTTEEKVIVVSHYTQTLNVVEAYCQKKRFTFNRLDGSTPQGKRMELVNSFNKSSQSTCFIFLLSAKAGGVGLNLVAASRLVLLDSSWNPSHDLQAMARIHRDGQKRPVHIYRLLTTGTIEEKIYQRQITKMGLSDSLMGTNVDDKSKGDSFSPEELRDLFNIHLHTTCHTHDLLACSCSAAAGTSNETVDEVDLLVEESDLEDDAPTGGWMLASQIDQSKLDKQDRKAVVKKKAELAALDAWIHLDCTTTAGREDIQDILLRDVVAKGYHQTSTSSPSPEGNKSRLAKLLDAIDIDNVQAPSGKYSEEEPGGVDMTAVAGGSVTFMFTKTTL